MAFNKDKSLAAAKRYIQKGQIDKAILEYKRIVEDEPHDAKNLQRLAELYVRQGSRQDAISVFLTLGDLLIRQGFSNRAISIYKQILQLNPLLIPVYIKLSEIFKTLGLSKDARLFNQRAVEIVQKAGSVEDVYKLLVKIIEIDQEDAISRIALAETCLKMKQNKMAIEQFEAALPLLREQHLDDLFIRAAERLLFHKPDNVELCRELAILHMNRKEIPKSMKLLLHCRKLDPDDIETLDLLIAHFLQTQNNEKAVLVLLEKGKLLNKRGAGSEAREVFRKILKIDPSNDEAKKHVGADEEYGWDDIQPQAPPPPAFEPSARAAPAGTPIDSALHEEIAGKFVDEAEIFIKYGLRQKALEHLFKGIEETSGSPAVREKLKDLYLDMGDINLGLEQLFLLSQQLKDSDPERAGIFLKEILLINPNEPRAMKMLESLGESTADTSVEPIIPLESIIDIPFTEMPPARSSQEESFLEQETSDLITRLDVIDSIHDLEEPFRDGDVIPPVLPSSEISSEELRALDTETMEEAHVDDLESFDTDSIEEISDISEVSEISAMDISHMETVSTTDEISTEEFVALETETRDDMFPKPEADESTTDVQPVNPSLELARGPRSPAIDQVLDEADFFASQGLAQEALVLLEDLLDQYPGHSLIVEKISEMRQKKTAAPSPKPPDAADDGWEPQLSVSQVADEALEELGALEKIISPIDVNEPLEEGLISSPSEIDAADAQTHHDLGIAYMEMGLWDQAIGEFRVAAQNLQMEATCFNLIGTCLMNEGNTEDAIKEYKMGLFAKEKTPDQEMSLYYDLASAYIQMEDLKEGLYYLQNIKKKNPHYKDVNAKIVELTNAFNSSIARQGDRVPKKKPSPSTPQETAKEVDDAFDDLFGDFGKKK